jgi:hypothetical protein
MKYTYKIESNAIIEIGEIQIRWFFKELEKSSPLSVKFGKFYSVGTIQSFNRTKEFFLNDVIKNNPELII